VAKRQYHNAELESEAAKLILPAEINELFLDYSGLHSKTSYLWSSRVDADCGIQTRRAIILLCVLALLIAEVVMANDKCRTSNPVPRLASDYPLFIATVYPVINLDMNLVEYMKPIEDAYSLWGKPLMNMGRSEYAVFTSPFSYPFKFSEHGKNILISKLKNSSFVDQSSVSTKICPSVSRSEQRQFGPLIPEDVILNEEYISFRVSDLPNISFMRFPTFTVILLDHSEQEIRTPDEYAKFASEWRGMIEQFGKMTDLKQLLGIEDQRKLLYQAPILVFVSFRFLYEGDGIFNRYFGGRKDLNLFKKELSLLPAVDSPMNLKGYNMLFHEYYSFLRWRIYYSEVPIFFDGEWRLSTYPGGVFSAYGSLSQILRSVLFTHVVMPANARESQ
jgi:hypothetical protein